MATRIGIDVGGTFTDLIYYDDETGKTEISKVPSVPESPERACAAAIDACLDPASVAASRFFVHSSTVALNTLLQNDGARTALLCTRGFRDILELRRGTRVDQYNLVWSPPPPLVPRHLRIPISERMLADGSVHQPVDPADVEAAARFLADKSVDSVAIAFLHAWRNPKHETEVAELLRQAGFKGDISLSHKVSAEYREYERTSTVVVDAFVRPRVSKYLGNLEDDLSSRGFSGRTMVNRSGGGALTFGEAIGRPFETIMSGPVAGVEGASEVVRALGLGDVVTADVGGTSFDTCLVLDGRAPLLFEGKVAGHTIQAPWTDVRSIGAGGGSIAWIDPGGLLQVGPQSAGASPGPACYRRGGVAPTVTDAALWLGMIGPGRLASGIRLDGSAAEAALETLAGPLGLTVNEVARGVIRIATASMANAIREITLERGVDPRNLSLFAFGGAGPLLALQIAQDIGMKRVIVPPFAGNFSAWGLLGSDLVRSKAMTRVMPLSSSAIETANGIFDELFDLLDREVPENEEDRDKAVEEAAVDMRYAGQEHTISMPLCWKDRGITDTIDELEKRFAAAYRNLYSSEHAAALEIVSLRATRRNPIEKRRSDYRRDKLESTGDEGERINAWSFAEDRVLSFRLLQRHGLEADSVVDGPAIVIEETSTTYLDSGYQARVDRYGCLEIVES